MTCEAAVPNPFYELLEEEPLRLRLKERNAEV